MATNLGVTYYEDEVNTGFWYGLAENVDLFNEASGGAIVLEAGAGMGRKPVSTFWDDISGLVQSRDPSSTSTLTPSSLTDTEHRKVKIFRSAPVDFYDQQFEDTGLGDREGARIVGQQLAREAIKNYLTASVSAVLGAINAIGASYIQDSSTTPAGSGTLSHTILNNALAKFGDRRTELKTLVLHSIPQKNLIGTAFSTQAIAYQVAGAAVYNGGVPSLGLRQLVTDITTLTEDESSSLSGWTSSNSTNYFSLALRPGAVRIKTGPFRSTLARVVGSETTTPQNMKWRFLAEWSAEVEVAGVSYKSASSNNPSDSVLATSTNWELAASSGKFGPGVLIKTDG